MQWFIAPCSMKGDQETQLHLDEHEAKELK